MVSPDDDDDSVEDVLSALVEILGYSGLLILGILICIAVVELAP